jgi:alpha-tubulin suppressor-like RCC1 family protein
MAFSSFSSFSSIQNYSLQKQIPPPLRIYPNVKLFASGYSCFFQNPIGKWYVWGRNQVGQLGNNDTTSVLTPTYNSNLDGFIRITSTSGSSFGLNSSNQWYVWGYNGSEGQLGMNTTTSTYLVPRLNTLLNGFTKIVTNLSGGSFGLNSSNQWKVWGYNFYGQLGMNTAIPGSSILAPQVNARLNGFTQIIPNNYGAFGLDSSNNWEVWGYNGYGELGMGNDSTYYLFPIVNPRLKGFTKIIANQFGTFGLDSSNNWEVWGMDYSGQLGMGTNYIKYLVPIINTRLNGFTKIVSIYCTCFGLDSSNNWEVWGNNTSGQLGMDTTTFTYLVPIINTRLNGFTQIILGDGNMFGLDSSGNIEVCGNNDYGTLGNNTTTGLLVPTVNTYLSDISNLV